MARPIDKDEVVDHIVNSVEPYIDWLGYEWHVSGYEDHVVVNITHTEFEDYVPQTFKLKVKEVTT